MFTIFIDDDRYSVPTIDILMADTEDAAIAQAAERLASSRHYMSIEICLDERVIGRLPSPASRRRAPPCS